MDLANKLNLLASTLDDGELDNYRLLLGIAAGGLAPHGKSPTQAAKAAAFSTVLQTLEAVHPSGVAFRGRPSFMTDSLLLSLQDESRIRRRTAKKTDRYFLGCGGTKADVLSLSDELIDFVQALAPGMEATGIASYIFYDEDGCGQDPHIDTEIFSLNLILMLEHSYVRSPSHLLLYHPGGNVERVLLTPGEILLLYAGGTVHAREDIGPRESVSLLTIGFSPSRG